jgi:hypothetical protein
MGKTKEPAVRQSLEEAILKNPKIGLFVAELALRDGDIGGAAEAVDWTANYGRKLMQRYPQIRAVVTRMFEQSQQTVRERWTKMHDRALAKVAEHLENPDPRISLEACKVTIERVEGRPRQGIDLSLIEREEDAL